MSDNQSTFHPFSRLPAEIRQTIWHICLPKQVCELDEADPACVYDVNSKYTQDVPNVAPCVLWHTTSANACPPAITRICRESRSVAFKAGELAYSRLEVTPSDALWSAMNSLRLVNNWRDRTPDVVHSYWTDNYMYEHGGNGLLDSTPVKNLASFASCSFGRASIMIERLDPQFFWDIPEQLLGSGWSDDPPSPSDPSDADQEMMQAFQRLPSYLVVMQVIVVHTDFRTAAATGLFGLLCDAPIQIVEWTDQGLADAFFDLAERCENDGPVSVKQDFKRRPLHVAQRKLRDAIVEGFGTEGLVPLMHPAYMFRLCTLMCNHPAKAREPLRSRYTGLDT